MAGWGTVEKLAHKGIDILATINGSPYEEGKSHTRVDLCRRRARQVNAPVIYLNQVGGRTTLSLTGPALLSAGTDQSLDGPDSLPKIWVSGRILRLKASPAPDPVLIPECRQHP